RVLEAIAGADAPDLMTSANRFKPMPASSAAAAVKRARIAFADEDIADHASPEARHALEKGVAEFKRIAPSFARATLPAMPYGPMVQTVYGPEGAEILAERLGGQR